MPSPLRLIFPFWLALGVPALVGASGMSRYYDVETIPPPPGIAPACGGIDFLPDGRLVAVFDQGEVCIYDPATREWASYASGLHTPLGVIAVSPQEVIVVQRPELTQLLDTDGDGRADTYRCLSDAWGMSGNYHEFAFGATRDRDGSILVPLGSGSTGGVARYEKRGEFRPAGRLASGGHFSVVPYRGWVVRIGADGHLTPIASGFRQPNGIGLDAEGRIFVTDNQGDWVGTSKLFHVVPGRFYGHAASLVWRNDFKMGRSLEELDRMRTEAAVQFPHAVLANSPGQPVYDATAGKFGPFSGQLFVPEFVIPRLLRVMLEEVAGAMQGAATTFFAGAPLQTGTVRLAFAPDGSLWCGQSERPQGWPGAMGIQRLTWRGETPFDVAKMSVTDRGFAFTFTKPVDPTSAQRPENYTGVRYYYQYQAAYGSPRTDVHPIEVESISVTPDGRRVDVTLSRLQPGYLYEFNLTGIRDRENEALLNPLIVYTLNRLRDGTTVTLPRPPPSGELQGSGKDKPPGARLRTRAAKRNDAAAHHTK